MQPSIISREDARSQGSKRYFTGKPCVHGHIAERYVSGATCCACDPIISSRYAHTEKGRRKAAAGQARYRQRHPDRIAAAFATPQAQIVRRRANQRHLEKRRGVVPCLEFPSPPENGLCQSCGKRATLHLDHNHVTGVFRGWLCHHCNTGIGLLGDDEAGLHRALKYLTRVNPGAKDTPGVMPQTVTDMNMQLRGSDND